MVSGVFGRIIHFFIAFDTRESSCLISSPFEIILKPLHTSGLFSLPGNVSLNTSIVCPGISGA